MSYFLYLLAYPMEALVASQLPPEEFGSYLAIGTKKVSRGKLLFLELRPDFQSKEFNLDRAKRECVPDEKGQPKSSCYLGIYRVLERLPLDVFTRLHLVTRDGRTLAIPPQKVTLQEAHPRREGVYLYQELCPVRPLVVSPLDAIDFGRAITDPANSIYVPKLLYARLRLGDDPHHIAQQTSLPYANLHHLQNCIDEVVATKKPAKTVDRAADDFFYTAIMDGLYLAAQGESLYFPFPREQELKDNYYKWWRSAT